MAEPTPLPTPPDQPAPEPPPERVAVGRINSPWGVQGHVKVTPLTDNPERLVKGARFYVAGVLREVRDVRHPRGYPVIQFQDVTTPEGAEGLRNALIEIDEEALPDLPEGEYYVHDLVGLAVVTTDGEELGRLEEVLRTGSNDVYVVRRPGEREVLIPALEDVVLDVDLRAGRVTVQVMPGLLQ